MGEQPTIATAQPVRFSIKSALIWTAFVAVACWAAASCRLLYDHYGAVLSVFIPLTWLLFIFLTIPMLITAWWRRLWLVFWMSAMVLFSIRQAVLSARAKKLHAEAARIVEYVNAYRDGFDAFPKDLSEFKFSDDSLRPFIEYDNDWEPNQFAIFYHPNGVAHWGITHGYTPESGYWFEDD
jgi:hypothetical protein